MNDLLNYITNLNQTEIDNFINETSSEVLLHRDVKRVTSDTTWIDMVEESIPYLDNIIRNPRRFIVQEENIVPIEKAKVVTEESIKHLAQNTSLIQEVKEDGSIIPLKLLNVYREETFDLYENRFIKSLVDNLYTFVENKLKESDQRSYAKVGNKVTYKATYKSKKEVVNVNVNLDSVFEDEIDSSKDGLSLNQRIEHIRDVIGAFKNSNFIKSLKESSPVRSPIRKTNVILKEQNFIKALDLWEFLEKNNIKPVTSKEEYQEDLKNGSLKKPYDMSFFIDAHALKETGVKDIQVLDEAYITKLVNDFVLESDMKETEFKKLVNKKYQEAYKRKEKIQKEIESKFNDFFEDFENIKKKAFLLLK